NDRTGKDRLPTAVSVLQIAQELSRKLDLDPSPNGWNAALSIMAGKIGSSQPSSVSSEASTASVSSDLDGFKADYRTKHFTGTKAVVVAILTAEFNMLGSSYSEDLVTKTAELMKTKTPPKAEVGLKNEAAVDWIHKNAPDYVKDIMDAYKQALKLLSGQGTLLGERSQAVLGGLHDISGVGKPVPWTSLYVQTLTLGKGINQNWSEFKGLVGA
ncbi:hypothetical protein B0T24DRAFT_702653, partial [Lasiosphaeria ovina]